MLLPKLCSFIQSLSRVYMKLTRVKYDLIEFHYRTFFELILTSLYQIYKLILVLVEKVKNETSPILKLDQ